jgi:hypothetical protein
MTEYLFGSGTLIGKRTDVSNTMPALLGTLQDVSLDFSQKIESLFGQYKSPVAFGGGEFEIKGKAKFARFQATQLNNLFLGQTQAAASGLEMVIAEAASVPATSAYTVQVANHLTFKEDLGVYYAATGIQLQPVTAGSEALGSYSVASTGIYTFAAADASAALLFYYSYTVTTEQEITLSNQLMGPVPTFELFIKQGFIYFGVAKSLVIKLNSCVSEKLSMPFTNTKFSIAELDIMAGADAAGNIGTISMTE